MSNQIVISSGAKVRNLDGVLTGTTGIVNSVPLGGPNGVATLDSLGKVPLSQLPASIVNYLGTWNAATNTPTLTDGVGDVGDLYICNVAGTVNFGSGPITFAVGDWVIYNGTTWERSSGATGTVTSVSVTESGDALTITGSPITTSGTINIGFAGTSDQYVNGAGGLTTFPSLTGYVPYIGATSDVDLGTYGLKGDYIGFNTTPSSVPTTLGTMSWDSFYRTVQLITGDGDTTLQVGQEQVTLVHNNTGSTLTDGQVVYVTGSTGELPSVALASNTTEATSSVTFGVVTETILNGADGFITTSGMVHGLNTLAFNEGDTLWLGSTAGTFTNVKPVAPNNSVLVGYVVKKAGGNGSIFVKIQNGYELEELHDVLITSVADKQGIFWDAASGLWKNNSIAGILGYTPQAQLTLTTTGSSGAATLIGSTLNIPNYSSGLGGYVPYVGATGPVNLGPYNLTVNSVIVGRGTSTNTTNIAIGDSNTMGFSTPATGGDNTAVGSSSLYVLSTGYGNTAVGRLALGFVTTGIYNTAVGNGAGSGFTSGSKNTMIGYLSGYNVLSGSANTLVGGWQGENPMSNNVALSDGDGNVRYRFDGTNNNFYQKVIFGSTLGNGTYTYTLPSATGTLALTSDIPSLTGYIKGSGTTNYVPKFSASDTITNSLIYDNGNEVGINTSSPYDSSVFSLDVNGGLIVKKTSTKDAQIALINADPAGGGNNGFMVQTVGGTEGTSFVKIQGYYGTSVAGSTILRLNPEGGGVLINSATNVTGGGALQVSGDVNISGAFKINGVAISSGLSGSGTTNYIPKFTGSTSVGNSSIQDDASTITFGLPVSGTSGIFSSTLQSSGYRLTGMTAGSGALYYNSTENRVTLANYNSGGILNFEVNGGTYAMRINANGNVGIGNTGNASYKLLVSGNNASVDSNGQNTIFLSAGTSVSYIDTSYIGGGSYVPMAFGTGGSERMRITSTGNVGIGTSSPGIYDADDRILQIYNAASSGAMRSMIRFTNTNSGTTWGNGTFLGINDALDLYMINEESANIRFGTAGTERMRITSSGELQFSSIAALPTNNNTIYNAGTALIMQGGSSSLQLYASGGRNNGIIISETNNIIYFNTNNTGEKMRITSGGYLKASNNGSYQYAANNFHELNQSAADWIQVNVNKISSGTPLGFFIGYPNISPNNTGSPFFQCDDSVSTRFRVRSNGGIENFQANNVNLSDERTKKDIIPLESYWDKFKAIEIVKFKYKDQTHDDFNIGVIAQQVESVAPEFIDVDGWGELPEDGVPLKSVYTADLHHATIKVLQECMVKIEELKAEIDQLKNK